MKVKMVTVFKSDSDVHCGAEEFHKWFGEQLAQVPEGIKATFTTGVETNHYDDEGHCVMTMYYVRPMTEAEIVEEEREHKKELSAHRERLLQQVMELNKELDR